MIRAQELSHRLPQVSPRIWLEVPDAGEAGSALTTAGTRVLGEPREINTGWVKVTRHLFWRYTTVWKK
ncbi:MAG: hypothetical protein JOZ41_06335 [Chloroflexi bacterium]|nr:hypothetical protein [Chloroflexota bacterium]